MPNWMRPMSSTAAARAHAVPMCSATNAVAKMSPQSRSRARAPRRSLRRTKSRGEADAPDPPCAPCRCPTTSTSRLAAPGIRPVPDGRCPGYRAGPIWCSPRGDEGDSPVSTRRPRSLLRRLLMGLAVAILLLAGLEGVLQLTGLATRVRLRPAPAGADARRILLAVGDSVTQGIPYPEGYPAALRRMPEVQAAGIQVVRLAYGGKGWHHLEAAVQRWLADNPAAHDVTMLTLAGHNDCAYLAGPGGAPPVALQPELGPVQRALGHLATYRLLVQVVARARGQRADDDYGDVVPPGIRGDAGQHCRRQAEAGTARFQALAAEHDIQLILATYPVPADVRVHLSRLNLEFNQLLRELARLRGIPLLELSTCTHARPDAEMFQRDGVHLTRAGYQQLAECIADGLGLR
ncbi:MAG: SGNH/GDSL hydrolase family protein [Deltaproteobacteria bacterium]|nr:MAG: SGNH/GDSL hydrolase family protein [Deltaproteobacteria bacterium]